MRRFAGSALLVFSLVTCAGAQVPSFLEADPTGWKDIMPGPGLEGWTRAAFMSPTPMDPVSQWKMDPAGGILLCEGNRGHEWLYYNKELGDAIFHVEFRFTKIDAGRGYNSGVMMRNSQDGAVWYQAQAGAEGTGWLFGSQTVDGQAKRFSMQAAMKENRVKPAGEWNVFEMRAEGPKMVVWVNGGITAEKDDLSNLKGYAGLEAEGYRIEFRNVKLKELK